MAKFIHMADLHLGRAFQTGMVTREEERRKALEATYLSFEQAIEEAIDYQVDFIVIAGDIYDDASRSVKGQHRFRQALEVLNKQHIHVYAVHGNHDPLSFEEGLLHIPENLTVFPPEGKTVIHISKERERIALSGFSYPEASYTRSPLGKYPKRAEEDFHIGILHGQEGTIDGHEPYAPFRVSELTALGYDYWALGHIHERQVLQEDPPIRYSGNIQGTHRKEQGEKGVELVRLTAAETKNMFIPTAPIVWKTLTVPISGMESEDEFMQSIETQMEALDHDTTVMITLVITGEGPLHQVFSDIDKQQEWIAFLKDEIAGPNCWVDRIRMATKPEFNRSEWRNEGYLSGDIVRAREAVTEEDNHEITSELEKNGKVRRAIKEMDKWTEEDWRKIWDEAEHLLIGKLSDEERKR